MTELRATYRLQLGGGFGFARGARARARTCATLGISHLYLPPSFQAREGSTHGYDVVDPGSISNELGGADEFFALVAAVHEAGHGDRARHRPEPHGDRRREPLLGAIRELRAKFFDLDPVDRPPPALLRRRPPGRACARRTRRCSRPRTSWRCGSCARARSTGCGSTTPTGSPTPPATSSGCATAASSTSGWRRSSTPASTLRDWPVDGTVGYEFLNDVCGAVRRPRGRGAADRPVGGDLRRRPALRRATPSRPSSSRRGRRSRPRSSGCCATAPAAGRRARARAGVVPGLPHLRRAVVGAVDGRGPRGDRRGAACRRRSPRVLRSRRRAGTRSSPASSRRRRR